MAKTPKSTNSKKDTHATHEPQEPEQASRSKIPGVLSLTISSIRFLRRNWKVFLGIILVYGALNAALIHGFNVAGNLSEAKPTLDELLTGGWSQLTGSFTIFTYLLGTSGNSDSPTAGVYQVILGVVGSLAIIWTLRRLYAGNKVKVRDGFYRGMTPIVPFVLVLLVVCLQMLPLVVATFLYGIVSANGLAATPVEHLAWGIGAIGLSCWTLRMISSSLFALYIVTLPDMTPLAALRSARQLVEGRRFTVLRKILFLPIATIVLAGLLIMPLIMFATPLAPWVFYGVTMLALPVIHSYMYSLYRSML